MDPEHPRTQSDGNPAGGKRYNKVKKDEKGDKDWPVFKEAPIPEDKIKKTRMGRHVKNHLCHMNKTQISEELVMDVEVEIE